MAQSPGEQVRASVEGFLAGANISGRACAQRLRRGIDALCDCNQRWADAVQAQCDEAAKGMDRAIRTDDEAMLIDIPVTLAEQLEWLAEAYR